MPKLMVSSNRYTPPLAPKCEGLRNSAIYTGLTQTTDTSPKPLNAPVLHAQLLAPLKLSDSDCSDTVGNPQPEQVCTRDNDNTHLVPP